MVMAVMAVDAGVRAEICVIAVPSFTCVVWLPHHASGVKQSEPYASDVQMESNPRRSAVAIWSAASAGGPEEGQYPMIKPSFMGADPTNGGSTRTRTCSSLVP